MSTHRDTHTRPLCPHVFFGRAGGSWWCGWTVKDFGLVESKAARRYVISSTTTLKQIWHRLAVMGHRVRHNLGVCFQTCTVAKTLRVCTQWKYRSITLNNSFNPTYMKNIQRLFGEFAVTVFGFAVQPHRADADGQLERILKLDWSICKTGSQNEVIMHDLPLLLHIPAISWDQSIYQSWLTCG